jgi:hypothetical protein
VTSTPIDIVHSYQYEGPTTPPPSPTVTGRLFAEPARAGVTWVVVSRGTLHPDGGTYASSGRFSWPGQGWANHVPAGLLERDEPQG